MPSKRTIRMSKAVRDMAPLRSEVRGWARRWAASSRGSRAAETFDTVEALRKLAKARRANDAGAERLLAKAVAELDPQAAFNQAMAFTLYFELVNLAEENFRITLLRRRAGGPRPRDRRRAPDPRVHRGGRHGAQGGGVGSEEMQRARGPARDRARVHRAPDGDEAPHAAREAPAPRGDPAARAQPESTPDSSVLDAETVEREIASLWLTDRSRTVKPEVKDEARTGLWYFDTTLIETMPRLQLDMERALARHFPGCGRRGAGSRSARGSAATATATPR
jgi:phosphoenolpyruvate carboxylase